MLENGQSRIGDRCEGWIVEDETEGFDPRAYYFRLFRPTAPGDQKLPLVIWMHGYGLDEEYRNSGQLKYLEELFFERPHGYSDPPFFLLAMQCERGGGRWLHTAETIDDVSTPQREAAAVLIDLIDELLGKEAIDRKQVFLCGVSGGAASAWEVAARRPDLFAALVPMSGSWLPDDRLADLATVPVWTFHAEGEGPAAVENITTELRKAGGSAHLTVLPGDNHHTWHAAFKEHGVLAWMLGQEQGRSDAPKPGESNFTQQAIGAYHRYLRWNALWPRVLPVVGIVLLYVACRRRTAKPRAAAAADAE